MKEKKWKTYLFEYHFDGGKWSVEMKAESVDDALARMKQINDFGLDYTGELWMTLPCVPGMPWLPNLVCWIRGMYDKLFPIKTEIFAEEKE